MGPRCRFSRQPILSNAARTRFALVARQLLIRNGKGNAKRRRGKLTMGDAVSDHLNRQPLDRTDRLVAGLTVAHNTRQFEGLRDPAPVLLPIKFDR